MEVLQQRSLWVCYNGKDDSKLPIKIFHFCRLDCRGCHCVSLTSPTLVLFSSTRMEKRHQKTHRRCRTLRTFWVNQRWRASHCRLYRTFPQSLKHDPIKTRPHLSNRGVINIAPVLAWPCRGSCPDSSGVKGHLAGSWWGFLHSLTRETAEERGDGAASLAAVAYWTESRL